MTLESVFAGTHDGAKQPCTETMGGTFWVEPTCCTMEAHHSDRQQCPPPIALVPDLEPELLVLVSAAFHLLPRRNPYLVQLRLERRLFDGMTTQSSQG